MNTLARALLIILAVASYSRGEVANVGIERIDGVVGGDKIPVASEIVIYIRIRNTFSDTIRQVYNGFRIYSPDSAVWFPHPFIDSSLAFTGEWIFDTTFYGRWTDTTDEGGRDWKDVFHFWWAADRTTPVPAVGDTVGFLGYVTADCPCSGVLPSAELITWVIQLDSVVTSSVGRAVCIDSSAFGELPWVWFDPGTYLPTWGGPYCFEIVADCCEGFRGNINLDWLDQIDIGDLTALVGWMFKSGSAPQCMLEADVDGNDSYDIQDVTYLVGYMFKGGPEPAGCP